MRDLTKKQKNLLDKWCAANANKCSLGFSVDVDMLDGTYEKLEAIHDTEILWQNVNRYVSDYPCRLRMAERKMSSQTTGGGTK